MGYMVSCAVPITTGKMLWESEMLWLKVKLCSLRGWKWNGPVHKLTCEWGRNSHCLTWILPQVPHPNKEARNVMSVMMESFPLKGGMESRGACLHSAFLQEP
jgi:hypothetical protein